MAQTCWAVDGPDGTSLELGGRKFSSDDDGAPMMCNLVCSSMGRHVHVDYCGTVDGSPCDGPEIQHNTARMLPNPEKAKDYITHRLYWRRIGVSNVPGAISYPTRLTCVNLGFKGHEDIFSLEISTEVVNRPLHP
jgi:hypothetical protein